MLQFAVSASPPYLSMSVSLFVCMSLSISLSVSLSFSLFLWGHPFMTSTRRGRGSGSGGRMWTGEGVQPPCGRPHRKLKLESTDVILSSSHAKDLYAQDRKLNV